MNIIDSHQHFWKYDPAHLPWITDSLYLLKRDFLPADLRPIYNKNSINGCVAVQAIQTIQETYFLLDLADRYDFIKGVVGWIDLRATSLQDELQALASFKKLKGFRHILQDEPDSRFICDPEFQRGLEVIFSQGYRYDILVFPHQLHGVLETVNRFPEAYFVIDHLAKPDIKHKSFEEWKAIIQDFKNFSNVFCKLSGMVTEHDWRDWKKEDFYAYLDVMMDTFGEDRLMFGSDWPVCLLAANYQQVKEILESYLEKLPKETQTKIWSENAIQFYNLKT